MAYLKDLHTSRRAPFSIVQVIPGTVMGSSELVSTTAQARAKMDRMSRALLFNDPKPRYLFGFVHVEDCARVHVEALDEVKVPDDEIPDWFIAASSSEKAKSGAQVWKEAGDVIEDAFQNEVASGLFTIGRNNMPINMPYYVDSTWTETRLFGDDKFRSLSDCMEEVGKWYRALAAEN
ncbi:hypothetical protein N0V90_006103 [Kalmusia sp. IMI 367209]|nr:hypothetical protein N0V90_006103 [Kalmusia sp. IMI 367209]